MFFWRWDSPLCCNYLFMDLHRKFLFNAASQGENVVVTSVREVNQLKTQTLHRPLSLIVITLVYIHYISFVGFI